MKRKRNFVDLHVKMLQLIEIRDKLYEREQTLTKRINAYSYVLKVMNESKYKSNR